MNGVALVLVVFHMLVISGPASSQEKGTKEEAARTEKRSERERAQKALQEDLKLWQGSWQMILREREGELSEIGTIIITFCPAKDGSLQVETLEDGVSVESGVQTMNATASPKEYDFKITGDSELVGQIFKGIYRFQGDTAQICVNTDPKGERPKEFVSRAGSKYQVVVWRRLGTVKEKSPKKPR